MKNIEKATTWYFLLQAFFRLSIISFDGVFSVYIVQKLSWSESKVFIPAAVMHLFIAVFELPTGAFADVYGNLKAMRLGYFFIALSFIFLILSSDAMFPITFPLFFVCLFSLGWTFVSGASTSWFVKTTSKQSVDNKVTLGNFTTLNIVLNSATLLGAILYSQFAISNFKHVWVTAFLCMFCSFLISFKLIEDEFENVKTSFKGAAVDLLGKISESGSVILKNKALIFFILLNCSVYMIYAIFFHCLMMLSETFNISDSLKKTIFQTIWPCSVIFSFLGALISKKLITFFVSKNLKFMLLFLGFIFILIIIYCSFIKLINNIEFGIILLFLSAAALKLIIACCSPWIDQVLNNLIVTNKTRATILSFYSLCIELFAGILGLSISFLLPKSLDLNSSLLIASLICFAMFLFFSFGFIKNVQDIPKNI